MAQAKKNPLEKLFVKIPSKLILEMRTNPQNQEKANVPVTLLKSETSSLSLNIPTPKKAIEKGAKNNTLKPKATLLGSFGNVEEFVNSDGETMYRAEFTPDSSGVLSGAEFDVSPSLFEADNGDIWATLSLSPTADLGLEDMDF